MHAIYFCHFSRPIHILTTYLYLLHIIFLSFFFRDVAINSNGNLLMIKFTLFDNLYLNTEMTAFSSVMFSTMVVIIFLFSFMYLLLGLG